MDKISTERNDDNDHEINEDTERIGDDDLSSTAETAYTTFHRQRQRH